VTLTLADGTFSLEGNGPKPGIPKQTDFIAASTDRVALDYSLAEVMGVPPESVEVTMKASGSIGTYENLENVCLPPLSRPPAFDFQKAEPNFVAKVERKLRGNRQKPGSDGPLIGIMKYGAKRWYNLAYHMFGQKRKAAELVYRSRYGPQWRGLEEEIDP